MASGCLHIYTGNGKGKTTAALGLLCRAVGAGYKVALIQFDKGCPDEKDYYSERNLLRKIKNVDLFFYGCSRFDLNNKFRFSVTDEDKAQAQKGLKIAEQILQMKSYQLIILDEIITAAHTGLISQKDIMHLIEIYKKNRIYELVMTGIEPFDELIKIADLVTKMENIKHYFQTGRRALKGIDF